MYARKQAVMSPDDFVKMMKSAGLDCGPDPVAVSASLANGMYVLRWSDKEEPNVEPDKPSDNVISGDDQLDDSAGDDAVIKPVSEKGIRKSSKKGK